MDDNITIIDIIFFSFLSLIFWLVDKHEKIKDKNQERKTNKLPKGRFYLVKK